jgi:hypothetical protein
LCTTISAWMLGEGSRVLIQYAHVEKAHTGAQNF